MICIKSIQRSPVKGLSPEVLPQAKLTEGACLAGDRAFAIENGPSGFNPQAPAWRPKARFLCWMRNPRLACLKSRYDDTSDVLTIESDATSVSGDLSTAEGRERIESFLSAYMDKEQRGPLKVLSTPGHSFSDVSRQVLSLINLASVEDIGNTLGANVDARRFRGNVHIDGLEPWIEATWVGRILAVGEARLKILKTTQRCLATHVHPDRGERDLDIMGALRNLRGDLDCGIYAAVVASGAIRQGDEVRLV